MANLGPHFVLMRSNGVGPQDHIHPGHLSFRYLDLVGTKSRSHSSFLSCSDKLHAMVSANSILICDNKKDVQLIHIIILWHVSGLECKNAIMRFFVLRDGQCMAQILQCCHHHNFNPWTVGQKFTQIQRKSKESSKLFLLLLVFLFWLLALLPVRRRTRSACLIVRTIARKISVQ